MYKRGYILYIVCFTYSKSAVFLEEKWLDIWKKGVMMGAEKKVDLDAALAIDAEKKVDATFATELFKIILVFFYKFSFFTYF